MNLYEDYIENEKKTCSWFHLYYGNISKLLEQTNKKNYIEIGIAYGFHIESILNEFPEVYCYGIDPYIPYDVTDDFGISISNIDVNKTPQENFDEFSNAINTRLLKFKNFKHIRSQSNECYNLFNNESIDLIFIDGNHTYDFVKNDCINWWPKIDKNGIMCGDDYHFPEVKRAVDEFCIQHNLKLEFITKNNNYYTWYIKKNNK